MSDLDTFTQYPLTIDVQTHVHVDQKSKKKTPVQIPTVSTASSSSKRLKTELDALNELHKDLVLNDPEAKDPVFPPSIPMDPKRSAQVDNWVEIGNVEYKKGNYEAAINAFKLGMKVEYERPIWDWHDKVREECAGLSYKIAEAHAALEEWSVAALYLQTCVDIEQGTEMKILSQKVQNPFEAEQMRQALERVRARKEKGLELLKKVDAKQGKNKVEA
ncbi:hypothetical protein GGS20DRAFT_81561 [Poronia punctata]|nr:hypothetical protein GGS20DRAFT_81561 [Poronia punctata]